MESGDLIPIGLKRLIFDLEFHGHQLIKKFITNNKRTIRPLFIKGKGEYYMNNQFVLDQKPELNEQTTRCSRTT